MHKAVVKKLDTQIRFIVIVQLMIIKRSHLHMNVHTTNVVLFQLTITKTKSTFSKVNIFKLTITITKIKSILLICLQKRKKLSITSKKILQLSLKMIRFTFGIVPLISLLLQLLLVTHYAYLLQQPLLKEYFLQVGN